jgi:hypothetical protein
MMVYIVSLTCLNICMTVTTHQERQMSEMILGLYPQPEDPPETVVVVKNGRQITLRQEDLWAYSADAATYQPPTTNEQEEETTNDNSNTDKA